MILVQGFDFFNQNLVKFPIQYYPDHDPTNLVPQIPTNPVLTPNATSIPQSLQIARLANATSYNYTSVGVGPCEQSSQASAGLTRWEHIC
jgi:hypothetical protein